MSTPASPLGATVSTYDAGVGLPQVDLGRCFMPVCQCTHRWAWDWERGRWRVSPGVQRNGVSMQATGQVLIFEDRYLQVAFVVPTWPEDQVECLKRAFCECVRHHLTRRPYTSQFHMEAPVELQGGCWGGLT